MQISDGGSGIGPEGVIGAGLILFMLGKMAWDKFLSREGRAANELVSQLSTRITNQEERLKAVEIMAEEERQRRIKAEHQVSNLTHRVWQLENHLRQNNIEVPT